MVEIENPGFLLKLIGLSIILLEIQVLPVWMATLLFPVVIHRRNHCFEFVVVNSSRFAVGKEHNFFSVHGAFLLSTQLHT